MMMMIVDRLIISHLKRWNDFDHKLKQYFRLRFVNEKPRAIKWILRSKKQYQHERRSNPLLVLYLFLLKTKRFLDLDVQYPHNFQKEVKIDLKRG